MLKLRRRSSRLFITSLFTVYASIMPTYPETQSQDVIEFLHGEAIADPYRWLEDGEAPETSGWTDRQNELTESYLAAVPAREEIRRRLGELLSIGVLGTPTPVRGRYFYLRRRGGRTSRCSIGGMGSTAPIALRWTRTL